MESFLTEVARAVVAKHGERLQDVVVVFPSQRARLFFSEALLEICKGNLWSPRFKTVDELMCSVSQLRSADRLRLISELYRVYSNYHDEDFDRFYHWGEMLVADFDMVEIGRAHV